jgi:hypothetical protein
MVIVRPLGGFAFAGVNLEVIGHVNAFDDQ